MSKKTTRILTPEWSRKIEAERVESEPFRTTITASPEECRDLARRMRVSAIEDLQADLALDRERGSHIIHVTGTFKATVTQPCIVTLEPVREQVEEVVDSWFSEEDHVISLTRARRERQGMLVDAELPVLEEKDDPEPIIEGQIDLGEMVAQNLALAINPYPRAQGTGYPVTDEQGGGEAGPKTRPNPFTALKNWKFRNETEK